MEEEDNMEGEEEEFEEELDKGNNVHNNYPTIPLQAIPPPSLLESPSASFSRPLLSPNSSLISPRSSSPPHHHHHQQESREPRNGQVATNNTLALVTPPTPTPRSVTVSATSNNLEASAAWQYKECLRNHAARLGAHVLDGCGEFMPSSDGGPLLCTACGCHRNFHRREVPANNNSVSGSTRLVPETLLLPAPHMQQHIYQGFTSGIVVGASGSTVTESSSEELRGGFPIYMGSDTPSKKRIRTKFTQEQKEQMRQFALRIGWRIQKPDNTAVEEFCKQIGVSRRVLKVWMHNNKHLAKIPNQEHQQQEQLMQQQQQQLAAAACTPLI